MDNLKEKLKEQIIERLNLKDLKPADIGDDQALFVEGIGLDSIDALELVVSLEKQFGVTVPNSSVARTALATVNSIHDYILAQRAV